MIALAIILTGLVLTPCVHFSFLRYRAILPAAVLAGTGICCACRHGSVGHLYAHHTEGALAAGAPEGAGLISAALIARITGNHILSLAAGMASFWLLGWLVKKARPPQHRQRSCDQLPNIRISVKKCPGVGSGSTIQISGFIMFRLTILATVLLCISSITRAELWKDHP